MNLNRPLACFSCFCLLLGCNGCDDAKTSREAIAKTSPSASLRSRNEEEALVERAGFTTSSSTLVSPAYATPHHDPAEREKNALQDCNLPDKTKLEATIETLASLQLRSRCVEDFLHKYPHTGYWQEAYMVRGRMLNGAMAIIRELDSTSRPVKSTDIVAAQKLLMDSQSLRKLKTENFNYTKRALEEITIAIHRGVFYELKAKGLAMGDPRARLDAANRTARQLGIWETIIEETRENGQFLVTRWVTERSSMFLIEGYGLVTASVKVPDIYFNEEGAFSDDCKVLVSMDGGLTSYPCGTFLSGSLGADAVRSLSAVVQESLSKKARQP